MEKPVVFLSHSSKNKREIAALKQLLDRKAAGFVDFFLSSDGESIPLGTNWVLGLNEALKQTILMFVFVSREALQSDWILFEAGFAYGRERHVVPFCLPGTNLGHLPAPLKLLQAHALHSARDLAALAKKCNDTFGTKIPEKFTSAEFNTVFTRLSTPNEPSVTVVWDNIVSKITAELVGPPGGIESLKRLCRRKQLNPYSEPAPKGAKWSRMTASGMTMMERSEWTDPNTREWVSEDGKLQYEFTLSPRLFGVTAPILDAWSKKQGKHACFSVTVDFDFGVELEREAHELTTKLFESEVAVFHENFFGFRRLRFSLFRGMRDNDWAPQIRCSARDGLANSHLPELVNALLTRDVLTLDRDLAKQVKKAK